MKKQFSLLAFTIAIAAFTQAQNAQQASFKTTAQSEKITAKRLLLPSVTKNFYSQNPAAVNANATWAKTNTGYVVRFNTQNVDYTVFLDRKGNKDGEMKFYGESNLNSDVRRLIKSHYFDYTIKSVKEINANHGTAYFITVEDAASWKVIHVVGDELEISEEHLKG